MSTAPTAPRIAIASLTFEGNSFSDVLTDLDQFRRCYYLEGQEVLDGLAGTRDAIGGAIAALATSQVHPLLAADAGAGGRVASETYGLLKYRLLERLQAAGEIDGLYLALHGAMITEDLDDAEGDLLASIRNLIGPGVPIAVSCDLHGHITPQMAEQAEIIIGYKLYPHDDAFETGARACELLLDTVAGTIKPRTSLRKLAALFPVPGQITTAPFPMSILLEAARDLETRPGILAASYFPVQPWLDVPDVGFAAAVVTDRRHELGMEAAKELCELAWSHRHAISTTIYTAAEAIRSHRSGEGLVLLADVADCVGGGAPGTSAEVIEALLEHASDREGAAVIAAPDAVLRADRAGTGVKVEVTLGQEGYGPVLREEVLVEHLFDGRFTYSGGPLGGVAGSLGRSAVLRLGKLRVLATTHPAYEYGDEQFAAAGIDLQHCRFAVVKNPVNARLAIPNQAFLVLDTVGPTSPRLAELPWRRLNGPCFPMTDAPAPLWRA